MAFSTTDLKKSIFFQMSWRLDMFTSVIPIPTFVYFIMVTGAFEGEARLWAVVISGFVAGALIYIAQIREVPWYGLFVEGYSLPFVLPISYVMYIFMRFLSRCHRHAGNYSIAIDLAERLRLRLPEDTRNLKNLAAMHVLRGDVARASTIIAELRALDAENPALKKLEELLQKRSHKP